VGGVKSTFNYNYLLQKIGVFLVLLLVINGQIANAQVCNIYTPICSSSVTLTASQVYPPGTYFVPANAVVTINGTLANPVVISFTGSTIYMYPGSRFSINNYATLDINTTTIRECTMTWDGIELLTATSALNVIGTPSVPSLIRGADEAITDNDNGNILISKSILNDNYIHVRLLGGTTANPTSFQTYGTAYTSNSATIPASTFYSTNTRTWRAFDINLADSKIIGSSASAADLNIIDNADFGFFIFKSGCEIYNFEINNITNLNPSIQETAILARAPLHGTTLDIKVGGFNPNERVLINHVENGISVNDWYNVNIINNVIDDVNRFGIVVEDCSGLDININANVIYLTYNLVTNATQAMVGIFSRQNDLATVLIDKNELWITGMPTVALTREAHGIRCEENSTTSSASNTISGNMVNGYSTGIFATNAKAAHITNSNIVRLPFVSATAARYGIRTTNCELSEVVSNDVISFSTYQGHRGIFDFLSKDHTIRCNSIEKGDRQITFNGTNNSTFPDGFIGNGMHKGRVVLYLDNNPQLNSNGSATLASDNFWEGPFTINCIYDFFLLTSVASGTVYCRTNPTTPTDIFDPWTAGCISTTPLALGITGIPPTNPPAWICGSLKRQSNRSAEDSTFSFEYDQFKNYLILLSSYDQVSVFELLNVAKKMQELDIEPTDTLYQLFDALEFHEEAALLVNVGQLINTEAYANALSSLENVTFANKGFEYQALVYTYLCTKNLYPDSVPSSALLDTFSTIAYLCPFTYGPAVFEARVIANIDINEESSTCDNQDYQRKRNPEIVQTKNTLSISPMPATAGGSITINTPIGLSNIMILNQLGQIIYEETLDKTLNKAVIQPVLSSGVYILKVTLSNGQLSNNKLIIH